MLQAKMNECANVLMKVMRLWKKCGFTADVLEGSFAEGRKS